MSRVMDFIAILVIVLAAFLVYSPHLLHTGPYRISGQGLIEEAMGPYPYPLHVDGWQHAAIARRMIDTEGYPDDVPTYLQEKGFSTLVAEFSFITPIDYIHLLQFIPAMVFFLTSIVVYAFFKSILESESGGMFAIGLLAFIPSNAYILGNWFIVSINITVLFLFSFMLVLHLFDDGWMKNLMLSATVLCSVLTYPFTTLLLMLYYLIYMFEWDRRSSLREAVTKSLLRLGALTLLGAVLLFTIIRRSIWFPKSWAPLEYAYSIPQLMGMPLLILALIGITIMFRKEKVLMTFSLLLSLYFLSMSWAYAYLDVTYFIPYQRILLLWLIILTLPAAYALGEFVNKYSDESLKQGILTVLVLLAIVVFQLPNYYTADPPRFAVQKILSDDNKELLYMTGSGTMVLADPFLSFAITPITGNRPVATVLAYNALGDPETYDMFLEADCQMRNGILSEDSIDFIISDNELDCPSMELVAVSGSSRLYKTRMD